MRIVMFHHSLLSDWNHGNAHFLRGVASELLARGYGVSVYEPRDSWSLKNLLAEHGKKPLRNFRAAYPTLESVRYDPCKLDLDKVLSDADVVIVHEWNSPEMIRRIGEHRAARGRYRLLFHDTHHRLVSDATAIDALDLSNYDGVLAYGRVLRDLYIHRGIRRAWTWHEAADTRVFFPRPAVKPEGDLIWIGNWGDDERTEELEEFLIEPVRALGLRASVFGVRYPEGAKKALAAAGIEYGGWLPNFEAPKAFARFKVTVHIPRRPYVKLLPGIPTIRVFEALACGIPMVCSPWNDSESLFTPGCDFLIARNGKEMKRQLAQVLRDESGRRKMAEAGLNTIRSWHTCAHRVDQLLAICAELETASEGRSLCAV